MENIVLVAEQISFTGYHLKLVNFPNNSIQTKGQMPLTTLPLVRKICT